MTETAWTHLGIIAGIGVPILCLVVVMWWDIRKRQIIMHKQNIDADEKRDQKLNFVLVEHPMHSHDEWDISQRTGQELPLSTRGLSYPKTKFNGS